MTDKYSVTLERFDGDDGYRHNLVIRRFGEVVSENYDGGEPEDNLFTRDWSWVVDALLAAYQYGLDDGKGAS